MPFTKYKAKPYKIKAMAGLITKVIKGVEVAKEVVKLAKETGKPQSELLEKAKENIEKIEQEKKAENE